ncbi:helix-turn-helix transcriptional regulator [Enterococcus faecium]|uniref:helix-turn-helix domain-containing protein n=4 Tax=Enterococcus faecium TaxID=1352 RepID=UPI0009B473AF|nr:helix-turn-helix transcriptional regulator [Enterococcus faecium]MDT6837546.1 helix-turn-helix transcriptional regulator [Enterococcus faecium]MDV4787455.1 helix-turn-helix transcriptional regulator [Enterococcus faecium]QEX03099.1 helix-turn-helix transcriptional regulator [Enterococcus faecium]HAR0768575.1 helix-turn-helix transcriptional regulator [Enterococcus faecium]
MEDLGSKLRELRVKKGYTQEYVARKFNVTRQTISKWENNKTTPDIETLKKICEFYSTNINSILNEDNSKNKKNNLLVLTAIIFNRIRQKSPILYRWVMNAVRYEGYRW